MALFKSSTQNPYGLNRSSPELVWVTLRGGSSALKGSLVRFDIGSSDGGTTASTAFGNASSPTANVLPATGSHTSADDPLIYLYAVLMQDLADDQSGWACIRGVVQALGGDTSAAGTQCTAGTGSEMTAAATKQRVIGFPLETSADATLKWFVFDGINGFGFTVDVTP